MADEEKVETTEAAEETVEIPKKFKELVETIDKLSVLELSELVKVLEKHYGVSAAAPMAMAAAPAAGAGDGDGAAAAEEKSTFTVMLTDAGASKINVIKAVREITGLGLAESKAVVDGAPKAVKENISKADAEDAAAKLKEAGATVELQ
jgi:large subunit ribosomal protein L7/L12